VLVERIIPVALTVLTVDVRVNDTQQVRTFGVVFVVVLVS
jgi:ABC-type transport system involved in cytochrome c biogenesis permease subunit